MYFVGLTLFVVLCVLNAAVGKPPKPPAHTSSDYDCVTKICTKNNPGVGITSFYFYSGGCSLSCSLDDGSYITSQIADKSPCGKDKVCYKSQCVSSTSLEACLKVVPDVVYISTYGCQTTCTGKNYTNTKQIPADDDLPCGGNSFSYCPLYSRDEQGEKFIDRRSADNMQPIMDRNAEYNKRPIADRSAEYNRRPIADRSAEYNRRPIADRSAEYNKRPIMDRSAEKKPISERLLPYPCGGGCNIPNYDLVCKSGQCTPIKQTTTTTTTTAPA